MFFILTPDSRTCSSPPAPYDIPPTVSIIRNSPFTISPLQPLFCLLTPESRLLHQPPSTIAYLFSFVKRHGVRFGPTREARAPVPDPSRSFPMPFIRIPATARAPPVSCYAQFFTGVRFGSLLRDRGKVTARYPLVTRRGATVKRALEH
jgi:hypothetical protein